MFASNIFSNNPELKLNIIFNITWNSVKTKEGKGVQSVKKLQVYDFQSSVKERWRKHEKVMAQILGRKSFRNHVVPFFIWRAN